MNLRHKLAGRSFVYRLNSWWQDWTLRKSIDLYVPVADVVSHVDPETPVSYQQVDEVDKPRFHTFGQFAQKASMPHGVIGSRQIKEHCSSFEVRLETILYVCGECSNLIACVRSNNHKCEVSFLGTAKTAKCHRKGIWVFIRLVFLDRSDLAWLVIPVHTHTRYFGKILCYWGSYRNLSKTSN